MRGRSYSPSPPPPPRGGYGRRRSPSPRGRYGGGGGGRSRDLPTSLLVRNLRHDCRPEDIRRPFEQFGALKDIYLPRDYYTGEPRGFGFVQFVDPADAAEAKRHMDGRVLLGRELTVVFAEENRKKPSDMRARERGSFRGRSKRRSPPRYSRSPPRYSRSPPPRYARSPSHGRDYSPPPKRRHYSSLCETLPSAIGVTFVELWQFELHWGVKRRRLKVQVEVSLDRCKGALAYGAYVGVNIGTDVSDLPSASDVVAILKANQITHVRLYNADSHMLKALSNSGIEVMVGVLNEEVLGIGESPSAAAAWINKNVAAYLPSTNITAVSVGSQVLTSVPNAASVLVTAMNYLHKALVATNLNFQIKVSTPHSMDIIPKPFPPSTALFDSKLNSTMYQILQFLKNTNSYYILSTSGRITGNSSVVFCVAKDDADADKLQSGLNWACGQGQANCSAIQPGQPCYLPNNIKSHASYAFNDYYQKKHSVGGTCNFDGAAMTTTIDPSSGSCKYTGSTNSNTSGGFSPPVALGPVSPLGGSSNLPVSRTQFVIPAAFLSLVLFRLGIYA
ncbi:hypothetical protein JRO89_XS10G0002700 [Xanthoceras sorbifolium]|uniref:glucan endo-1,3-beta-D-glucosidase n=1 Tax=Xanthoceras sorbifolium TaxID=99658 RepID=A0ABQ8HGY7_9ROSI|nr:hypothetical protein JRO89_XS10G0002700 [Xanthoceras sorbifolium]